jgi:hypothetical protein
MSPFEYAVSDAYADSIMQRMPRTTSDTDATVLDELRRRRKGAGLTASSPSPSPTGQRPNRSVRAATSSGAPSGRPHAPARAVDHPNPRARLSPVDAFA